MVTCIGGDQAKVGDLEGRGRQLGWVGILKVQGEVWHYI